MNILCIDVGTSGMRGILYDHTGQNLLEYKTFYRPLYFGNGWVEQDPSDWENALYSILNYVSSEAKIRQIGIDAVSFTAFRSSVIPVDKKIHPLHKAVMWQDKRTDDLCEKMQVHNRTVNDICGAGINSVFSGIKMRWIRENIPEIYEKIYKFMVAADYIIFLLTGEICTDYTYGSRSNLMSLRTCQWDDKLLDIFHIDNSKLCRLIEPGSVCGYTTGRLKNLTGFPDGIPVITAGGDQQCSALGQGVVGPGILSVTAGTGGFLITNLDRLPEQLKDDVICNYSSIKNQYIVEYSMLTCCSAYDWCRKEWFQRYSFDELEYVLGKTPPGSNGCLCVPYFMGRSTPDWNRKARGAFFNLSSRTTKWDMLRSLLEGICYELKNGIDTIDKYVQISDIFINGGLTNSKTFNKMQADIYGMKIVRRGQMEATARGALIVALTALGVYASVQESFIAISLKDESEIYDPDEELTCLYEKYRRKMNVLYKQYTFLEENRNKRNIKIK